MEFIRDDELEAVLVRFDLPELSVMRQVNRRFRRFTSTPQFANVYNARIRNTPCLIVQIYTQHSRYIGDLLFISQGGVNGRRHILNLRRYFEWLETDGGTLSLASASGCLVLFTYEREGRFLLIVLNVFTGNVHWTELTQPVDLDNTFAVWHNTGFNTVPFPNGVLGFNITDVFYVDNEDAEIVIPPRRRRYQFPGDTWVTLVAGLVGDNQNIIPAGNNVVDGMFSGLYAFVVYSHEGGLVYRLVNDDMLLQPFNLAEVHFPAVPGGWESYTRETFGRNGWATSVQHLTHPDYEPDEWDTSSIGGINLFQVANDGAYRYVSTFPGLRTLAVDYAPPLAVDYAPPLASLFQKF